MLLLPPPRVIAQPPLRAPSGQLQDDIFSTLPPAAPGPVKSVKSDDLFDDLISDRKKSG